MNIQNAIAQKEYFDYFDAMANLRQLADFGVRGVQISEEKKFIVRTGTGSFLWERIRCVFDNSLYEKNRLETEQKFKIIKRNISVIQEVHKKLNNIDFESDPLKQLTAENYYTLRSARLYNRLDPYLQFWNESYLSMVRVSKSDTFWQRFISWIKNPLDGGYRLVVPKEHQSAMAIMTFARIKLADIDKRNDNDFKPFYFCLKTQSYYLDRSLISVKDYRKLFLRLGIVNEKNKNLLKDDKIGELIDIYGISVIDKYSLKHIKKMIESGKADLMEIEDCLEELELGTTYKAPQKREINSKVCEQRTFDYREDIRILYDLPAIKNDNDKVLQLTKSIKRHFFSNNVDLMFSQDVMQIIINNIKNNREHLTREKIERWIGAVFELLYDLDRSEEPGTVLSEVVFKIRFSDSINGLQAALPEWSDLINELIKKEMEHNPQLKLSSR